MNVASALPGTPAPLVVHLIYRLDFGGLETLLAECVNRIPAERYRHAIVCLTDYTDFSKKITQPGVPIIALHKQPGLAPGLHWTLWKLLRRLKPTILHSYNLAAMEYAFTARAAGVPVRVHAEHGRDMGDPDGVNRKHNFLRRRLAPFIDRYVPVSHDLQLWLEHVVGIPSDKLQLINNGVDTERFRPGKPGGGASPWTQEHIVIGSVGRIQDIKDQAALVRAFAQLREQLPQWRDKLRLSIIGDGPLLPALRAQAAQAGLSDAVWLPGARADVAELMPGFSVFALPSLAEGTPVTLLEAMACGLPVVASAVGGIPDVVQDGINGLLVPAADDTALTAALARYVTQGGPAAAHGQAARARIEQHYSMAAMLSGYVGLYDALCQHKLGPAQGRYPSCAE